MGVRTRCEWRGGAARRAFIVVVVVFEGGGKLVELSGSHHSVDCAVIVKDTEEMMSGTMKILMTAAERRATKKGKTHRRRTYP